MTDARLAGRILEAAEGLGVPITHPQAAALERYALLLEKWNERINLTALPLQGWSEPALVRLLLEPLAASKFVADSVADWLDIGSGGGSPAIPLKVVRPDLRLTMVESRARKAAFLREVCRSLNLVSCAVHNGRAEDLSVSNRDSADLVTDRAVRLDEQMVAAVSQLLRPAGRLLVFATEAPSAARLSLLATHQLVGQSVLFLYRRD